MLGNKLETNVRINVWVLFSINGISTPCKVIHLGGALQSETLKTNFAYKFFLSEKNWDLTKKLSQLWRHLLDWGWFIGYDKNKYEKSI